MKAYMKATNMKAPKKKSLTLTLVAKYSKRKNTTNQAVNQVAIQVATPAI